MTAFVKMEIFRQKSDWNSVIKYMQRAVSILDMCKRGRILSLVKSHATLNMHCVDHREEVVCGEMRKDSEIGCRELVEKLERRWPGIVPLFDTNLCYHKSPELRRMVHMALKCKTLLRATVAEHAKFCDMKVLVAATAPKGDWIEDDFINDMHGGDNTRRGWEKFVYHGIKTVDTLQFQIGGLNIPALEINYQKQKEEQYVADKTAKKALAMDRKRRRAADSADDENKTRKKKVSGKVKLQELNEILEMAEKYALAGDITALRSLVSTQQTKRVAKKKRTSVQQILNVTDVQKDVLKNVAKDVAKDSALVRYKGRICGFKFATTHAKMRESIGTHMVDTMVFVKIGETLADFEDSKKINLLMASLGMPSVVETLVPVIFDEEAWTAHSQRRITPDTEKWGPCMLKTMKAVVKRHEAQGLNIIMKISELYDGVRLSWLGRQDADWCKDIMEFESGSLMLGKTLIQKILFDVYVGKHMHMCEVE